MKARPCKNLVLAIVVALALAASISILISVHGHVSVLGDIASDIMSYAMKEMGWVPDSTGVDVLFRMGNYHKHGRDDDAIRAGEAWTEKNPKNDDNLWIYENISALYLEKAKSESGRAEEYVSRAIVYRDKAIPFASHSIFDLQTLASLSESAGDLSPGQRCVQYRNAAELLDVMRAETEKLAQAARQVRAQRTPTTYSWVEALSEKISAAVTRVKVKLQDSGCHEV